MAVEGETTETTDTVEEPVIVVDPEDKVEEPKTEDKVEETDEQKTEDKVEETDEQKTEREALEALRSGAPEGDYSEFKLPENVTLDEGLATELKAFAKQANLSQAATQGVVDLAVKQIAAIQAQEAEGFNKLAEGWVEAAKTDPKLGAGSEEKYQAVLADAAKFRDTFGTPELVQMLNESRFGDHPEVIRLFAKAGRAIKPAAFVNGGKPTGERTPGQGFYDNSNMK